MPARTVRASRSAMRSLAIGYRGTSPLELEPVRYVELHVEQGDQLERAAADIAAVSGPG